MEDVCYWVFNNIYTDTEMKDYRIINEVRNDSRKDNSAILDL